MNDTISRQTAIDAICTEGTRLERNGTVAMAEIKQWCVDILEALPSVDNDGLYQKLNEAHNEGYDVGYWAGRRDYEQKWIPCSEVSGEGYPKEYGFYYVTERNYGFYLDADNKQNVAHTSHFFNGDFTDRFYDENHSNIVAWMSLPKPYEERKEE